MGLLSESDHYQRVKEFMKLAGQQCPEEPIELTEEDRLLRAKLMMEEVLETIKDGLGVTVRLLCNKPFEFGDLVFETHQDLAKPFNLIEVIDGCLDTMVVTTGTLIACGVPDADLQSLVDQNNLAKFGPGGYRREDGKWVKPPGHKPPDIQGELDRQAKVRAELVETKEVESADQSIGETPYDSISEIENTLLLLEENSFIPYVGAVRVLRLALDEIKRLQRRRWWQVEIVAGPGYECGVIKDTIGHLQIAVREVGKDWKVPEEAIQSSLVIEPGHTAYWIESDGT